VRQNTPNIADPPALKSPANCRPGALEVKLERGNRNPYLLSL